MARIAVLDDYQRCAIQMTDWSSLLVGNEIRVFHDHVSNEEALAERLRDFEIVVAMRERTSFPASLLKTLPQLRLLVTTGRRNNLIDLKATNERGILACYTDSLPYPAAELTWGLILSLLRHIPQEDAETRRGSWQTSIGVGLHGKVIGIIGLGRLGSQVARVASAFQMSVLAWSQNLTTERAAQCGATPVSKEEIMSQSDIVTIHLQLSERTRGLIGEHELDLMKPTAYLINTSRGPIVDERALVNALKNKTIAGAGLDVFDYEPLPLDHPLRKLDNTVITPHVGYVTIENYHGFYSQAIENIQAFLTGSPIRVLNES